MNKYLWQFLSVGLIVGAAGFAQAGAMDQNTSGVTTSTRTVGDQTVVTSTQTKKGKPHRRAEGTNRSSRPGTSTGVHAVGGNDTPAPTGVPQAGDTTNPRAPIIPSTTTTY